MSKKDYEIHKISKDDAWTVLIDHHYISKNGGKFKSGENYGLFTDGDLVGVCIFTGLPVPEIAKGCFGLGRNEQEGLFELSRLCLLPCIQKEEHNITSWFVSRAIRKLKKSRNVRAILSYADCDHHKGTIYRACNFTDFGLTARKKDFWIKNDDGSYKKHNRGKVKGLNGEWRDRSRKRRFLMIFDKSLKCNWKSET